MHVCHVSQYSVYIKYYQEIFVPNLFCLLHFTLLIARQINFPANSRTIYFVILVVVVVVAVYLQCSVWLLIRRTTQHTSTQECSSSCYWYTIDNIFTHCITFLMFHVVYLRLFYVKLQHIHIHTHTHILKGVVWL